MQQSAQIQLQYMVELTLLSLLICHLVAHTMRAPKLTWPVMKDTFQLEVDTQAVILVVVQ